jgi:hypothetical protein
MGLRLRGPVRCGRCGKPLGIRHVCVTRIGTRTRRHRAQSPVTWECSTCHRPRGLRHTCTVRTDFKTRKRRQAADRKRAEKKARTRAAAERRRDRRRQAAADRRARERARKKAAKAAARTRPARPRGESHEPGTCGDRDCPKYGCKAYWRGMEDCPGPHDGG